MGEKVISDDLNEIKFPILLQNFIFVIINKKIEKKRFQWKIKSNFTCTYCRKIIWRFDKYIRRGKTRYYKINMYLFQ